MLGNFLVPLVAQQDADAGIEEGDVILEVEGTLVETSSKLLEIIGSHHPGDKVMLKVDRKGKRIEYPVTLRNQDGNEKMIERNNKEILDVLGIELEEIEKDTAKELEIKAGLRVTRLFNGTIKRQTDIKVGFIITKVDGKTINSLNEFIKYLENKKGGVMVEGVYEDYPGTYYFAFGL